MRRVVLLALLVAALAVAFTPGAGAARGAKLGIQDDAWLLNGPGTLDQRLDQIEGLGVKVVRYNLMWSTIAPTKPKHPRDPGDPAYRWSAPDAILTGLHARGIAPVVSLVGTPGWANGGEAPNWVPIRSASFANFAYATARRYSFVKYWLVWNEPNQRKWLRPTDPHLYVKRLLNPAYAAIHAAHPGAKVAGGTTAPRAATGGVSPVAWIRGMGSAYPHARLDAYAHHPYPLSRFETPTSGGCASCSTITMATLDKLLRETKRAFGPKPIWLTEYGYQTDPPDRFLGVSYQQQADYVGAAARKVLATPRVYMLIFYLYRDDPALGGFQSGLETADGTPKPSLDAFRAAMAQYGH